MGIRQIGVQELKARLAEGKPTYLVDVREAWEHDLAALKDQLWVPLAELAERVEEVQPEEGSLVVVYCHHGVRSLSGAAILAANGVEAVSLAGGIDRWSVEVDPGVRRY
jgi:rhodanese-related sulfurtransferase